MWGIRKAIVIESSWQPSEKGVVDPKGDSHGIVRSDPDSLNPDAVRNRDVEKEN